MAALVQSLTVLVTTASALEGGLMVTAEECEERVGNAISYGGSFWEFMPDYDCYGGDLLKLPVVPMEDANHEEHLKECASTCINHPECIGFNYPKNHPEGPGFWCYIKNKGDETLGEVMTCNNGRSTAHYDFYTRLLFDCIYCFTGLQRAVVGQRFSCELPHHLTLEDASEGAGGGGQGSEAGQGSVGGEAGNDGGSSGESEGSGGGICPTQNGQALPGWLEFDGRKFTGIPQAADVGNLDINVTMCTSKQKVLPGWFQLVVEGSETRFEVLNDPGADDDDGDDGYGGLKKIPTLPPPTFCHENDTMYEPLDMNYTQSAFIADSVEDCQTKCRETEACGYFTYYPPLKSCHKALPIATKKTNRTGFQAGPAICGIAGEGSTENTIETKVLVDNCLSSSATYYPLTSHGRDATITQNPIGCQAECAEISWATSFVYNSVTRLCDCQDENATLQPSNEFMVAGPPACQQQIRFELILEGDDLRSIIDSDHTTQLKYVVHVIEAAITDTAGNYTPFFGQQALAPRPVITEGELRLKFGLAKDSVKFAVKVRYVAPSRHLLYLKKVLSLTEALDAIRESVNWYSEKYGPEQAPDCKIKITDISGLELVPAPDDSCIDTPGFRDEFDYSCESWDAYDCDRATEDWSYSQAGEDTVIQNCPYTCETCDQIDALVMKDDMSMGMVAFWQGSKIKQLLIGSASMTLLMVVAFSARRHLGKLGKQPALGDSRSLMCVPLEDADVEDPILEVHQEHDAPML